MSVEQSGITVIRLTHLSANQPMETGKASSSISVLLGLRVSAASCLSNTHHNLFSHFYNTVALYF